MTHFRNLSEVLKHGCSGLLIEVNGLVPCIGEQVEGLG